MNVSRRTLYAVGAALVVALAIAGVVRFAFDDDEQESAQPVAVAGTVTSSAGGGVSAASPGDQQQSEQETAAGWTPQEIADALANPEQAPTGDAGVAGPSGSAAPGGAGEAEGSGGSGTSTPSSSEEAAAACKQPPVAPAADGLPYERRCAPALAAAPADRIGKLIFTKATGVGSSCTASVVNTSDTNGYAGNSSLLATAGHCIGRAPGRYPDGSVVNAWSPHKAFVFLPARHVKQVFANIGKVERGRMTQAAFAAWLPKIAWFGRVNESKAQIWFVPTSYTEGGATRYDFGTLVVAPRNGTPIGEALGSLGYDFTGQAAGKETATWGFPADPPFAPGTQLYLCTGKSRTAGNQVAANSAELEMGCDMTGGSSGGPWFVQGDTQLAIVSVNSGGPRNVMTGPHLNGDQWGAYTCGREFGVALPQSGSLCRMDGN